MGWESGDKRSSDKKSSQVNNIDKTIRNEREIRQRGSDFSKNRGYPYVEKKQNGESRQNINHYGESIAESGQEQEMFHYSAIVNYDRYSGKVEKKPIQQNYKPMRISPQNYRR